jgi:hypothetical protein
VESPEEKFVVGNSALRNCGKIFIGQYPLSG